jgi:NAD(P)-dependent dehydrogenase (short-subunit alcohol dehydrogenase family)
MNRVVHFTPEERGMSHQVVLITGALTGIGRASAVLFAKQGADVVVSGRRDAEGEAVAAELRGLGAKAAFVHADVRQESDVRSLVDQTVERFGRLDAPSITRGRKDRLGP